MSDTPCHSTYRIAGNAPRVWPVRGCPKCRASPAAASPAACADWSSSRARVRCTPAGAPHWWPPAYSAPAHHTHHTHHTPLHSSQNAAHGEVPQGYMHSRVSCLRLTSSKPCSTGSELVSSSGNTAPSVCRKWRPLLTSSLVCLSVGESRCRFCTSCSPAVASSLLKMTCGARRERDSQAEVWVVETRAWRRG
jgi:hypothetical protein